jgi:ABC-2 type transport system ATP-binding protein
MIEVQSLTKQFGPIRAVDKISFSVAKGEVLGFLGPNGAGKSTTMKMVTGFLVPTAGTAIICGHDIQKAPIKAKRKIGYLPEGAPLYADMTAERFLRFVASARGLSGAERDSAVSKAVAMAELSRVLDQPIETLSKGFKRRVGLAQALVHDPDVLVLDEPTDGLDPNQKHQVRKVIAEMSAEKAIVISTHILEEVDAVCSRALIITNGQVVADGTPGELEAMSRYHNAVIIRLKSQPSDADRQALAILDGVASVETPDGTTTPLLRVVPKEGASILPAVSQFVTDRKWTVEEIRLEQGHLDDVFRQITSSNREAA